MKSINLFLVGLILYGCGNDESPDLCADTINASFDVCEEFISVSKEGCIMKEAIVKFLNGNQRERFVYFHDGTNYYKIESHTLQNDGMFTEKPSSITSFTYQGGNVTETRVSFNEHPGSYLKTTYFYSTTEVKIQSTYVTDGVAGVVYEYKQFYLPQSKDSIYHHEEVTGGVNLSYLFEFKGGNRTRVAVADEEGPCALFGAKWMFNSKMYYDGNPNVLRQYAVRYPFNGSNGLPAYYEQFWAQTNANNMIGDVFNDGSSQDQQQYCWTFLQTPANNLFIKKVVMQGTEITYIYDCE